MKRGLAATLSAYVLHQYDWSESSLILDLFTRERGRLAVAAKGAKRPYSQLRGVLLPFQRLQVSLGRGSDDAHAEVHTLRAVEWAGGAPMPAGGALFSGFYLNELLLRLLARQDPHAALFDAYAQVLPVLAGADEAQSQAALRAFELILLREIGLLPELNCVTQTLQPVRADAAYALRPEAGIVPAAHGNDGGGSIRIPASVNGLVGFKSTRGRVSNGPDLGEAWAGLAHQGAITRTVRDAALMLDIVSGYETGDPYTAPLPARPFSQEVGADPGRLRVVVMPIAPGYACDPQVAEACRATGRLLASLGHQVEEAVPAPFTRLDEVADAMYRLFAGCTACDFSALSRMIGRPATLDDVEPLTAYHAARGLRQTPVDYLETVGWIHAFAREVVAQWRQFDIMVTPTVAQLPLPLGELAFSPADPQRSLDRMIEFMPFTAVFNMTGQPAVSLPLHMSSEGLPIGIQLAADWARDDLLLRVAAQLEAACPWMERRPRLPAVMAR